MRVSARSFTTLALLLCLSPVIAQPVPIQPGEYQVSSVTAAGSAEGVKPDTASRCIRSEDLANPESVFNNRFLVKFKPDPTCTVSNLSISASKIGYSTDCKYSTVRVDGTLTSSSYSVVRKAKPKGGSGPQAETRLEGKRVGPCK
jgi:hypothetical protein